MKETAGGGCGCLLLVALFNLAVGGMSVNYLLQFFLEKDIPWYADTIIGVFVAEISVPVAIVVWLLRLFGAL